jgi:hypothetical protein
MRIVIGGLALVALLLVATGPAQAQNLLVNGDFQSGSFSPGWVLSGDTSFTGVGPTTRPGDPDGFEAFLGPVNSQGLLTQTFPTTPGTTYVLDFWLANDGGTPANFSASVNGAVLFTAPTSAFAYTHEGAAGDLTFTATGATSTLQFSYLQVPAFWHLDGVSASPAPEPASLTLFGLGLVPLAGYAWRRRQKAAG